MTQTLISQQWPELTAPPARLIARDPYGEGEIWHTHTHTPEGWGLFFLAPEFKFGIPWGAETPTLRVALAQVLKHASSLSNSRAFARVVNVTTTLSAGASKSDPPAGAPPESVIILDSLTGMTGTLYPPPEASCD
ncbi:MAG: hypothetical protein EBR82_67010 [Caulobacteraceae bacterium]|nr:hypothetical protein [Caulobacteraceae bacterium]